MSNGKKLSNPFSTGGGGAHFEAHVQASFVVLMLTGGHAPCLPCWPIVEVKLQGKIDGYDIDDLVVFVEDVNSKERRRLLGQVKHSIAITRADKEFGEVMQAAWNDFNNSSVFTRGKDIIALITGPLSATDAHNVQYLLNQSRHTKDVDEFFRNVEQANFSPPKSSEKLEVIQHHLKLANGGTDVSRDELYDFLKHFHLLGYDLGNEFGVVRSLLHSHISVFQQQFSPMVWSRVVDVVQGWNQYAGTITPEGLPEDLRDCFKQRRVLGIPGSFKATSTMPTTDWTQHPDATYLALAVLIGSWQDKNQYDLDVVAQLLGISYDDWLNKAREILHLPGSPLSLKNGVWSVADRAELCAQIGTRLLDKDLETFGSLASSVLKEPDPAFELPADERYAASIYGKVPKYSQALRKGLAEGVAILGTRPGACFKCSSGKAEGTSVVVIRELLSDADWVLWGSLNSLLPTLAEAAPGEFLDAVEKTLRLDPCPFDELFSQEGKGITGRNYLTGLLWSLECLAWGEQYLVRVCVVLGELATRDPGGQWTNRPLNSLVTILLPWLPQTTASVEKRKVAVQTLFKEVPQATWNLILQLLPGQQQISSGSYKPNWLNLIPDDWEKNVSHQDYWSQGAFYSDLAVGAAGQDATRLSALIDHLNSLPKPAFDLLLQALGSQQISELPEEQRLSIWDHLTKFIIKHRRFSDAKWALPDESIARIEEVAGQLAPTNQFLLYQPLFADRDFDLYEKNGNLEEQRRKLDDRREAAVFEIFRQKGIEGVIRFAESVSSPGQVGQALVALADPAVELVLMPHFLDDPGDKRRALVSGYIWRCYFQRGWEWVDHIDKSDWTVGQMGQFLACLPFSKEAWDRASRWLQGYESEYWTRTGANAYQTDGDIAAAIEKLIEHRRPHAAISCLNRMLHGDRAIDTNQCVRALLAAVSSSEPGYVTDWYEILELIKYLQADSSVDPDDLFGVEWAYLPLLDGNRGAAPQLLEGRLANDPEFFCEVIRLVYRSNKEDKPTIEPTEESKIIATNAWRLLREWKTPPGTQKDGTFDEERFTEWLQRVKASCAESGHLEVALISIGEVLVHTPPDPNGLWIRRVVAAALNDRDADRMRDGFITAIYNSRDFHQIDPTGEPEKELAKQYRHKADEIENVGFQRVAVSLRGLADGYDREAERIIAEHEREDG